MADNKKTPAALLDDLAALDPPQRREVAATLRTVAETFAGRPTVGALSTHSGCWPTCSIRLMGADWYLSCRLGATCPVGRAPPLNLGRSVGSGWVLVREPNNG